MFSGISWSTILSIYRLLGAISQCLGYRLYGTIHVSLSMGCTIYRPHMGNTAIYRKSNDFSEPAKRAHTSSLSPMVHIQALGPPTLVICILGITGWCSSLLNSFSNLWSNNFAKRIWHTVWERFWKFIKPKKVLSTETIQQKRTTSPRQNYRPTENHLQEKGVLKRREGRQAHTHKSQRQRVAMQKTMCQVHGTASELWGLFYHSKTLKGIWAKFPPKQWHEKWPINVLPKAVHPPKPTTMA